MTRFLLSLPLVLAPACAPMVAHGPRVERGLSLALTAGAGYSPCDTLDCDLELLPQAALGLRGGRPATKTQAGYSVGANASINLTSSELDLYVQAPTGLTRLDAGAGVLLSVAHAMPYAQLGGMRDDGSGWYMTQGFVVMARRPADYEFFSTGQGSPDEMRPVYWAPSVAFRTAGRRALHLYVSGAFGTADAYEYPPYGGERTQRVGSQPVRVLMAGVIVEGTFRDLFVPLPLP